MPDDAASVASEKRPSRPHVWIMRGGPKGTEAECCCGWKSKTFRKYEHAERAAEQHRRKASLASLAEGADKRRVSLARLIRGTRMPETRSESCVLMSPAALRALADSIESADCTGIAATWCAVHGDCACPRDEEGVPFSEGMYDGGCPLHSPRSAHAASEVQGS